MRIISDTKLPNFDHRRSFYDYYFAWIYFAYIV